MLGSPAAVVVRFLKLSRDKSPGADVGLHLQETFPHICHTLLDYPSDPGASEHVILGLSHAQTLLRSDNKCEDGRYRQSFVCSVTGEHAYVSSAEGTEMYGTDSTLTVASPYPLEL
jgi:hypothetical protein